MFKKVLWPLMAFVFAFVIGSAISLQQVTAHEFSPPYRWWNSTSKHQNSNSSWAWAIGDLVPDYNSTDLTSSLVSGQGGPGVIFYQDSDLGVSGPIGVAIGYNVRDEPCASIHGGLTGNCNTTDKKVKSGYVYLNAIHYRTYINDNTRFIYKHETGHIFGLAHVECATLSVMTTNCPRGTLSDHDKNDLNAWY